MSANGSLTIPRRFNGPPGSANGGYSCGRLASLLDAAVVEVSLRSPPPLDRELELRREGERLLALDAGELVAEAAPGELSIDCPDAVAVDAAAEAARAGYARWSERHPFPTCVVCGPARQPGDGFRIFPGALEGTDSLYAADWTPASSLAGADGAVRAECTWAALDCPTSAPVANFGEGPPCVLARLTARIGSPPKPGARHSVLSWALERDGRKRHSAAALYDEGGELLAASRALWIELKQ